MNVMSSDPAFNNVSSKLGDHNSDRFHRSASSARIINLRTYSLREILDGRTGDGKPCPVSISNLSGLIQMQASLHHAEYKGDEKTLKTRLKQQSNRIRGFVIHGDGLGPAAYCIYFPMIDKKGKKVAYAEDFYITEAARGKGVFKLLMHELAKRARDDGAVRLQWATDGRNHDVHEVVSKKFQAKAPKVVTLDADRYLDIHRTANLPDLSAEWRNASGYEYFTSELGVREHNYPELPGALGKETCPKTNTREPILDRRIMDDHGGVPFKGLVTYKKPLNTKVGEVRPIAITPMWAHFSTFNLRNGAYGEQTQYAEEVVEFGEKLAIQHSIFGYLPTFAKAKNIGHLKLHTQIGSDEDTLKIYTERLGLREDTMIRDDPSSRLRVYILTNGDFTRMASEQVSSQISIKPGEPIGNKRSGMNARTPNSGIRKDVS